MGMTGLPVVVIGAGPVGLAAAAHLHEQGLPFVVFEAGDHVGASVVQWGHVRLFTPWCFNIDPAAARLLRAAGWAAPDIDAHPTGAELVERYLRPLASLAEIAGSLSTERRVIGVTRLGIDKLVSQGRASRPFVVTTEGKTGVERVLARAVIDASGTWLTPNPLGADGRPALGETTMQDLVTHAGADVLGADRDRFEGQRVVVVGSGHSAQNAVRDLAALAEASAGTEVTWVTRRPQAASLPAEGSDDDLPERGRLGSDARRLVERREVRLVTGFRIDELDRRPDGVLLRSADRDIGPYDRIVAATGFRPDLSYVRELRVDINEAMESPRALAPLIDPALHDCGSVPLHGFKELAHPEPDFYLAGAKSYGRAPTFLLSTGYEQVRSVVAELAGDHAAANEVRTAPMAGECSVEPSGSASDMCNPSAAACGPSPAAACGPSPVETSAGDHDGFASACRC